MHLTRWFAVTALMIAGGTLLPAQNDESKGLTTLLNPEVSRDISLREDQRRQIRQIFQEYRPKLQEQRRLAERAEADLREVFNQNPPDQHRGAEVADRLANARAEMLRLNTIMRLRCRAVLSAEQWTDLQRKYPNGVRPGSNVERAP